MFLLPGLLVFFLLSFTAFEVILDGVQGLHAIKRSIYLVEKNFGSIAIRTLILWLIIAAVLGIVSFLLRSINSQVSDLIVLFLQLIIGWFSLSCSLVLYKEVKLSADSTKEADIR